MRRVLNLHMTWSVSGRSVTVVLPTLGKQTSSLRCSVSTDGPPLRSGQWRPCVGEKEKWVLVIC